MKTNVPIELSDEDRSRLAIKLDGKETKRLATRKEVVSLARKLVQEFIHARETEDHHRAHDHDRSSPDPGPDGTARREEKEAVAVYAPSPDIPRAQPVTENDLWKVLGEAIQRARQDDDISVRYWLLNELERRSIKLRN